jgi:phage-related protein
MKNPGLMLTVFKNIIRGVGVPQISHYSIFIKQIIEMVMLEGNLLKKFKKKGRFVYSFSLGFFLL